MASITEMDCPIAPEAGSRDKVCGGVLSEAAMEHLFCLSLPASGGSFIGRSIPQSLSSPLYDILPVCIPLFKFPLVIRTLVIPG